MSRSATVAIMPRPKEFDREVVLATAREVFWRQGYKATSTEDLRLAMRIGRQSFYDTFGSKKQLYLEVLRRYNADGLQAFASELQTTASPLAALRSILLSFSRQNPHQRALGCMGVAAMCEFGVGDPEIAGIGKASVSRLEALLERLLRDAKARGEARASLRERAAARHLSATVLGLKVMSKAGATTEALRDVAVAALESIAPYDSRHAARTRQ